MIIYEQDGGCDYMIACGINYGFIQAENKQDALKKTFGCLDDPKIQEYLDDGEGFSCALQENDYIYINYNGRQDGCPDRVSLYELGEECITEEECHQYFVEKLLKPYNSQQKERHEKRVKELELAELERLQKKYKEGDG